MIALTTPLTETAVRNLRVGDAITITGTVYTGRDAVHKYLHDGGPLPSEINLQGGILYHCGPVIIKDEHDNWKCVAAGPTTSIREEPYQWQLIRDFGLRAVIGKGGMGDKTLAACKEYGCVYLHAIGGAAQVLAERVLRVPAVYLMDRFGAPEAIWQFDVVDFPAVVTMDAQGHSLHKDVYASSAAELARRL